jgi:DNA-binding NarL/FixJ family response regulator
VQPLSVLIVTTLKIFGDSYVWRYKKRVSIRSSPKASDGLEAVQQAEELHPDLILLDIGLPTLSGIEAGRRIRKVSPGSKILFVSQEGSADIVQVVLDQLGAHGYLLKLDAAELLGAIDAVHQGTRFVSSHLMCMRAQGLTRGQPLNRLGHRKRGAPQKCKAAGVAVFPYQ